MTSDVAMEICVSYFQNGGRCHASMNANVTYAQYGETPQRCKSDGKGGKRANQVYKIGDDLVS